MTNFSEELSDWSREEGQVLASQSALERDVLFLLVHRPACTWSELESLLQEAYPDTVDIDPDSLYTALDNLIAAELVAETAIEEDSVSYAVTDEGIGRAVGHVGWQIEKLTS